MSGFSRRRRDRHRVRQLGGLESVGLSMLATLGPRGGASVADLIRVGGARPGRLNVVPSGPGAIFEWTGHAKPAPRCASGAKAATKSSGVSLGGLRATISTRKTDVAPPRRCRLSVVRSTGYAVMPVCMREYSSAKYVESIAGRNAIGVCYKCQ